MDLSLKQAISWYLMSSYLYYIKGVSVITDSQFDEICRTILAGWKERKVHPHWKLLDKEALECGSGYHLMEGEYPWGIKSAAETWLKKS